MVSGIIWVIKSRRMRRKGIWNVQKRRDVHTGFWWGNLRDKDHLQYLGTDGRTILNGSSRDRLL